MRDVGPLANAPSKHRSWQPSRTRPSPFQRDVGGVSSLDGGPWEGITRGGTHEEGGLGSASPKRTTMKIVVRFHHFLTLSVPLTPSNSTTGNDATNNPNPSRFKPPREQDDTVVGSRTTSGGREPGAIVGSNGMGSPIPTTRTTSGQEPSTIPPSGG